MLGPGSPVMGGGRLGYEERCGECGGVSPSVGGFFMLASTTYSWSIHLVYSNGEGVLIVFLMSLFDTSPGLVTLMAPMSIRGD